MTGVWGPPPPQYPPPPSPHTVGTGCYAGTGAAESLSPSKTFWFTSSARNLGKVHVVGMPGVLSDASGMNPAFPAGSTERHCFLKGSVSPAAQHPAPGHTEKAAHGSPCSHPEGWQPCLPSTSGAILPGGWDLGLPLTPALDLLITNTPLGLFRARLLHQR